MIISRSPFRISFVGGGTDFDAYYKSSFGNVVSTTINKYIYVTLNDKFDGKLFLRYAENELVSDVDELQHDLVREALKMFGIKSGVEIAIVSDIPAKGSGLGSSSALAAALIQTIAKYKGKNISGIELAEKTCHLEIDILKKPIGRQDQYAICCGGFNKINFEADNIVVINMGKEYYPQKINWLEQSSMLFYLGNGRKSESILNYLAASISNARIKLDKQRILVYRFLSWVTNKKTSNKEFGKLINKSWELKKEIIPSASNEMIDNYISKALNAGAYGAKVCGAGGGGFLLVICDPRKQGQVRKSLKNLQELKFKFEPEGTKLIYAD